MFTSRLQTAFWWLFYCWFWVEPWSSFFSWFNECLWSFVLIEWWLCSFNTHFYLILDSWICIFGFFVPQLPLLIVNFMIVDLPDWIYSYAWWFLVLFVSSKLDWIFPSVSMMFLKIPDIFKVILDWICTSWIWMYSVVNLFGFFALLSQIPCPWIWTLISNSIHPCVDFIEEIIDSIFLFFLWQCYSEFVILGLMPWDDLSCSFVFGWWWKFSWFPSLLWNCRIYTFLLPFVISILDFIFTWIPLSDTSYLNFETHFGVGRVFH